MDWVKLDATYYNDRAIVRAGEAAEVLFLRCLAYCGAEENKGVVPKDVLARLTPTRTAQRLAALLREGLLTDLGDDVQVRSWAEWQEKLDTESDRRRKDRERKQAARDAAKSADESADESADVPGLVLGPLSREELEVEKERPTPLRAVRASATDRGNKLLDGFELHFGPTPRKALAAIGSAIDELVTEDAVSDVEIVGGLRTMIEAGVGPSLLAEMVRRAKSTGPRRYVPEPANRDRPWTV